MIEDSAQSLGSIAPQIWAALISAAVSLFVLMKMYKIHRTDIAIKEDTKNIAKQVADISEYQALLKFQELKSAAAFRAADALLRRHEAIRSELAELISLVELHRGDNPPFKYEVRQRAIFLCNSLSLYNSPKGPFAEEFNAQLGRMRAFFLGESDDINKYNLMQAFQTNAWRMCDSEFSRIQNSIKEGEILTPVQPDPHRMQYEAE